MSEERRRALMASANGGGVISGTFTVSERVGSVTVDVGQEFNGFAFWQKSGDGNQYSQDSSRYIVFGCMPDKSYSGPTGRNACIMAITNATGGTGSSIIAFTVSGNEVTLQGTGTASAAFGFSPYVTYEWIAW